MPIIRSTLSNSSLDILQVGAKSKFLSASSTDRSSGGATASGLMEAFRSNVFIYSAVKSKASIFAATKFHLYKGEKEIESSPILDSFMRPSVEMTNFDMMELISQYYDVLGRMYIYIDKREKNGAGTGYKIMVLDPTRLSDNMGKLEYSIPGSGYRSSKMKIDPRFLIRKYEPGSNKESVISAVNAAFQAHEIQRLGMQWNQHYFALGGFADRLVRLPEGMDDSMKRRVSDVIRQNYTGSKNRGRTITTELDIGIEKIGDDPKDMDWDKLLEASKGQILSALRFPKILTGDADGTNYANTIIARNAYIQTVILPQLVRFRDILNYQVLPMFPDTLGMRFEFDDPIQKTSQEILQEAATMTQVGAITPNEVRERMGMDALSQEEGLGNSPLVQRLEFDISDDEPSQTEEQEEQEDDQEKALKMGKGVILKDFRSRVDGEYMKRVAPPLLRFLRKQKKTIIGRLQAQNKKSISASDIERVLIDLEDQQDALSKIAKPILQSIVAREGRSVLREFNGLAFNPSTPSINRAINKQQQRFAKKVNDTTWDEIRSTLKDGIGNGEGIPKLTKRIDAVYSRAEKHRTIATARTESHSAANLARHESFKQNGVKRKQWITGGSNIRDEHASADGQIKDMDDPFDVGGEQLSTPGDPSGSAGNVINCKCTEVAYLE